MFPPELQKFADRTTDLAWAIYRDMLVLLIGDEAPADGERLYAAHLKRMKDEGLSS